MSDFKQYQTVIIRPDMTNCPGHTVHARILSLNEDKQEAFIQVLDRCQGCDCGASARLTKLKYLQQPDTHEKENL